MMQTKDGSRIHSIDILRGIVMIIMALDHTREFYHLTALTQDPLDPAVTTYPLFFTRWITHFCAPVFVFLSGVSAYLSSRKKTIAEASAFLMKRGLWLIIAEIVIVTFGITFNPFYNVIVLQVIWAIGMSLFLLGLLMKISNKTILLIGVILFFGHNIFDYVKGPTEGVSAAVYNLLLRAKGSAIQYAPNRIILDLYAVLPWTGVMFMGYSIGKWFTPIYSPEKRKKNLLIAGSVLVVLYIALRKTGLYGDPAQLQTAPNVLMSFLNTEKYPPSLQYLGMTLGPALLFLALMGDSNPVWGRWTAVYGRVPFFYYVLHFYILHLLAVILFFLNEYPVEKITETVFLFRPQNSGYNLAVTYLIWVCVVLVLYLPCKWFHRYKSTHNQWWLKYI